MSDSRADIEFSLLSTQDPSNNFNSDEDINCMNSQLPLTAEDVDEKPKTTLKDISSFLLSVFNLTNAIIGSGILGLAEVAKNVGIIPFVVLMSGTAILSSYTINLLLHLSAIVKLTTYEGVAKTAFGYKGKLATTVMIILHTIGAPCSYVYIIKTELPEVLKVFVGYHEIQGVEPPWYLNGNILVILVVLGIIAPLAAMKDIKFLGYSSAIAMSCMVLFTFTVVIKKFSIPCPLLDSNYFDDLINSSNVTSYQHEEEQICEAKLFSLSIRSAYAVPIICFSFMCHASLLPIYSELRNPSIKRMQSVTFVSIFIVYTLYMLTALFGYLTFFNKVKSELLLTYSLYNSNDILIIVARTMVLICVTLSIPLLHYPGRKTIILTFFRNPHQFSWFRHIAVMVGLLTLYVGLVMLVPNIRDIFGMSGATSSISLMVVFPSACLIKLTGKGKSPELQRRYATRRKVAWIMVIAGTLMMVFSISLILLDWIS